MSAPQCPAVIYKLGPDQRTHGQHRCANPVDTSRGDGLCHDGDSENHQSWLRASSADSAAATAPSVVEARAGCADLDELIPGGLEPPAEPELDLTSKTPVEIDTALAGLFEQQQRHTMRAFDLLARQRQHRNFGRKDWAAELEDDIARERELAEEFRLKAVPYEAEFKRRGGWARYFLVTNSNGHVHTSLHCQTTFPTTTFRWLIDLADKTEEELVAEWGEMACTICMPSAPAKKGFGDGTSTYARRTAEEKAERQRERDERQRKARAKELEEPVFFAGEKLTRVSEVERELREIAGWRAERTIPFWQERPDVVAEKDKRFEEGRPILRAALIAKGRTEEELDTLEQRAYTKSRRDYGLPA